MPNYKKISDLTDGGSLLEGDIIPILRDGVNYKVPYPDVVSYAQLYFDNATPLVTTLTTANTFYPLVSKTGQLLTQGLIQNMTANVSVGHAELTTSVSGIYRVNYSVSYSSNGNNYTYRASVFKNGTYNQSIASWRKVVQASTITSTSAGGLISLNAGDVVDLRFACDTALAQVQASHISFSLTRQHDQE